MPQDCEKVFWAELLPTVMNDMLRATSAMPQAMGWGRTKGTKDTIPLVLVLQERTVLTVAPMKSGS